MKYSPKVLMIASLLGGCTAITALTMLWFASEEMKHIERVKAETSKALELQERLKSLSSSGRRPEFPEGVLWTSDRIETSQQDMQSRVTKLLEDHDVLTTSFGAAFVPVASKKETVAFELEFEANLDEVYEILQSIETLKPPVSIHTLRFRTAHAADNSDEIRIFSQLVLWGLWEQAP